MIPINTISKPLLIFFSPVILVFRTPTINNIAKDITEDRINEFKPKYLQVHHIFPRTVWSLRHELKNGVTCCKASHFVWFESKFPHTQTDVNNFLRTFTDMEYLRMRKYNQTPLDYVAIELYLRQQIKEFKQKLFIRQKTNGRNRNAENGIESYGHSQGVNASR